VRNRSLHRALRTLADAASTLLGADVAAGADVPFELLERRGARASLYSYSPLTAEFVRGRMALLGRLPEYAAAVRVMLDLGGLDTYLRARGERRVPEQPAERVDAVLRCFFTRLWEDRADFEVGDERFEVVHGELEATVYATRWLVSAAVPVVGLALESDRVALGDGLWLVRADARDDLPADAAWAAESTHDGRGPAVALLELEARPDATVSPGALHARLADLRCALRLFDAEALTLAPVGWVREDAGAWQLLALGGGGPDDGDVVLVAEQEDELRAFINLVRRRRPRGGELRWALRRFELACERPGPMEALTDALLAGRVLLEPEGPGSGRLAQRLAALCAEPEDRAAMTERVAHAVSLERACIAGVRPAVDDPLALAREVLDHVRAILRDVICGHLEADLVRTADGVLAGAAEIRLGEDEMLAASGQDAFDDAVHERSPGSAGAGDTAELESIAVGEHDNDTAELETVGPLRPSGGDAGWLWPGPVISSS